MVVIVHLDLVLSVIIFTETKIPVAMVKGIALLNTNIGFIHLSFSDSRSFNAINRYSLFGTLAVFVKLCLLNFDISDDE